MDIRNKLLLVACLVLLAPSPSYGQAPNGALVDSTQVEFSAEAMQRLVELKPHVQDSLEQVRIERMTYMSDGLRVHGYLVAPKSGDELPGVILNRGGNRDFGAIDDDFAALMLAEIASWGYVVAASQYRGNAGGEGQEEFGGKDVHDVLNLIPLLESLPQADRRRIGMMGVSRGGMMTYQAMARTDKLSAAVVIAGITDQFELIKHRPEMETHVLSQLIPDYAENRDEELTARSVLCWPEKLHRETPLLILHGSSDWRVSPTHSLRLVSKLYELKHPCRFVFFEGGDHGLREYMPEVGRLTRNWFDKYLRDQQPWPSMEPHGD